MAIKAELTDEEKTEYRYLVVLIVFLYGLLLSDYIDKIR